MGRKLSNIVRAKHVIEMAEILKALIERGYISSSEYICTNDRFMDELRALQRDVELRGVPAREIASRRKRK